MRIIRGDSLIQLTRSEITRDDGNRSRGSFLNGRLTQIKPQISFARFRIRPMTLKTMIRENRPNIPVELYLISPGSIHNQDNDNRQQTEFH